MFGIEIKEYIIMIFLIFLSYIHVIYFHLSICYAIHVPSSCLRWGSERTGWLGESWVLLGVSLSSPVWHAQCTWQKRVAAQVQVQCCFTSTETIRTFRDWEPRRSTSIFTQLLSSEYLKLVHRSALLKSTETVRTFRDGEPRTSPSTFTQLQSSEQQDNCTITCVAYSSVANLDADCFAWWLIWRFNKAEVSCKWPPYIH